MPAQAVLLFYYSQTLRKELYLEPSLMHVMLLIVMYNTVCSPFSNFFFFIKQSEEDVSQFDSKFTRQTPVDSPDDSALSESANQVFLVSERLSSVAMGNLNMGMGRFQ